MFCGWIFWLLKWNDKLKKKKINENLNKKKFGLNFIFLCAETTLFLIGNVLKHKRVFFFKKRLLLNIRWNAGGILKGKKLKKYVNSRKILNKLFDIKKLVFLKIILRSLRIELRNAVVTNLNFVKNTHYFYQN